jgi:plasmid stability protein
MPNSRLSVVLDRELQRELRLAAKKRGKSLSATAPELLRDALECDEDIMLARLANKRDKSVKRWLGHEDIWKKFG